MALTINQNKIARKEFFVNVNEETIEKLTSLNNQAIEYQNVIASLSTVQDISKISHMLKR